MRTTTTTRRRNLSTSTLLGDDVVNGQGEDLGEIEDFMIDLPDGRIDYAVLSFGGFMGMGDKLFAVPFELLNVDFENKRVVLDVPKERLENAPGFDEDDWPDTSEEAWHTRIHEHYGTTRRS